MRERMKCSELTRHELEEIEEDDRCSSGLMCRGLGTDNLPAQIGWFLVSDENGYDHARTAYTFKFDADPEGLYCEDCAVAITEEDDEARWPGDDG